MYTKTVELCYIQFNKLFEFFAFSSPCAKPCFFSAEIFCSVESKSFVSPIFILICFTFYNQEGEIYLD